MVFNIFKKELSINIGEVLISDIHSHILPFLDDGAKSVDESISMLEALVELGFKRVVSTPHVMAEGYQNSTKKILETIYILKDAIKNRDLDIEIEASAEYYLDDGFLSILKSDDILSLCNGYILIETSYFYSLLNFEQIIYEILARGYKPLLAHPERYRYINDYSIYKKWKSMGISFQVEINSFNGKYGKDALKKAIYLSKRGFIDFLATDAHRLSDIELIKKGVYRYPLSRVISSNEIKNSLCS